MGAPAPGSPDLPNPQVLRPGREICHLPSVDIFARVIDDSAVASAYVELPDGWGSSRLVMAAWTQAGYEVTEMIDVGVGRYLIVH